MAGILASPQMMATMGRILRVGGIDMMEQENSLAALVGGRVLVQAYGMPTADMIPTLEMIDFAGLAPMTTNGSSAPDPTGICSTGLVGV